MEVVNKKVLADKVAEENGITKKLASEVIDTLFATMTEALKDGKKVDITGFGKFEVKQRAARTGINPQTKEQIQIAMNDGDIRDFVPSPILEDVLKRLKQNQSM